MTTGLELLTNSEMARADALAPSLGVPSLTLMEDAGRAIAAEATKMVAPGARITVLCGPGNNGGDGWVAARVLREAGYRLAVASTVDTSRLRGDAAHMASLWRGPIEPPPAFAPPAAADIVDLVAAAGAALPEFMARADLVVDALLGAGLDRPLSGAISQYALLMAAVGGHQHPTPILAVDVPTGLNGSSGAPPGGVRPDQVVQATRTVTFFRKKPGHLLLPGRQLCGEVVLAGIGMPPDVLGAVGPQTWANDPALWHYVFPRLRLAGHKYSRGHAVVVSGRIEMSGAARLCARGALRAGAGLVTVASPPDALVANASQLNATLLKTASRPDELRALLDDRRYNAVAIGPGLGRGAEALAQVMAVLASGAKAVLDADAISVAAASPRELFEAVGRRADCPVVLTPHEGEFKRMFPDLAGDKLERARTAAARSGAIMVLKGPDTVIATPEGRAAINENAPPTLATAGSGDVLAGFVTGLLAQDMPAFEAACAAVWLHGECANRFGPGLIAEDIPESLPGVLATLLMD